MTLLEPLAAPIDVLILSNGPGELATWVKPTVQAIRQQLGEDRCEVRISVVLSPCPNAGGQEAAIALGYPEVDRVQAAADFFPFLLWGQTAGNWDWRSRGVVVFLGGDQIFPVIIGKRLGYRTVVYAEWDARWLNWIDRFAVMGETIVDSVPDRFRHKLTVVGDLMVEAGSAASENMLGKTGDETTIGLLPGSKPAKLMQGVPLFLAVAEQIHQVRPHTRFVIPVAPALELQVLASYANAQTNPVMKLVDGVEAKLVMNDRPYLETSQGTQVELHQSAPGQGYVPPYELLQQCQLCLTTVGANTAELGALAVPMLVALPTNQLDAMRAWNGIPGLLANLPGLGSTFAKIINWYALRRVGLLAWPNIWAGEQIVPEMVGHLTPQQITDRMLDYLNHPEKLETMRSALRSVRGEGGAAEKLATIVGELAR